MEQEIHLLAQAATGRDAQSLRHVAVGARPWISEPCAYSEQEIHLLAQPATCREKFLPSDKTSQACSFNVYIKTSSSGLSKIEFSIDSDAQGWAKHSVCNIAIRHCEHWRKPVCQLRQYA
jgi:hypothetical protein